MTFIFIFIAFCYPVLIRVLMSDSLIIQATLNVFLDPVVLWSLVGVGAFIFLVVVFIIVGVCCCNKKKQKQKYTDNGPNVNRAAGQLTHVQSSKMSRSNTRV